MRGPAVRGMFSSIPQGLEGSEGVKNFLHAQPWFQNLTPVWVERSRDGTAHQ